MTENAGAAIAMTPGMQTVGTVGMPLACTEVKVCSAHEYVHFRLCVCV
jgi:long-subunit acyl-CoA synthetase (AMP-forming)